MRQCEFLLPAGIGLWLLAVSCHVSATASLAPPSPMRELLVAAGIHDDQWAGIRDGEPMSPAEERIVWHILFRLPQVSLQSVETWSKAADWSAIREQPTAHRGDLYQIAGRGERLATISVPGDDSEAWGIGKYYRLEVRLDGPLPRAVVFAKSVPGNWQPLADGGTSLNTPISAHAVFLKLEMDDQGQAVPTFVASSIAWHPSQVSETLGVSESHVLLAGLGMDLRLLDDVHDRRGLLAEDREGFYRLLAAVDRIEPADLSRRVDKDTELRLLLDRQEYPRQRGELVALTGNVKRAIRITVEGEDIVERLGFDHYYELNIFLDESVQLKRRADDQDPLLYPRYPVVCCVRSLPPGMPEGDEVDEAVRVIGFFFKLYGYETQYTNAQSGEPRQLSPLLVAPSPIWYARQSPSTFGWELAWGSGFVFAVAAIWWFVWRFHRDDVSRRR